MSHLPPLFRLAPDHILTEQLRVVHTNVPPSFIGAGLVSLTILALFHTLVPWPWMAAWQAAVWSVVVASFVLARGFLQTRHGGRSIRGIAHLTIALYSAFGAVWGALPWVVLSHAGAGAGAGAGFGGTALLVGVSAGMVAGGMAFMSPVLPVFLGYMGWLLTPVIVWLGSRGDVFNQTLAVGTVIFFGTVILQARAASRAFREMIDLRFENVELVERLKHESARAEAARVDAEQANLAKSKFLAAASHDLRQPVHAQGLFLEVLARSDLTAQQHEVLAHARAAGTASGEMLNTLLDFSRIEAGVITPQVRAFRLQPLLRKLENELAAQADAKGMVYRSRETQAVVLSDPALVELILRNLVLNAIRYTETGGVLVGCRTRGGSIVIEVWDTGIGIAPEHQRDVFREFHQLGNPERDRHKGLGLGLAIAKGLASRLTETQPIHALTLASRPMRGSVFRLALPLTSQAVAEDEDDATHSGGNVRLLDLHVLVIDDDAAVQGGMQRLLNDWGAQCDVAGSIDEALALLRAQAASGRGRPDLMICDYRLREQRTGAEAIAAVRAAVAEEFAGEFGDASGDESGAPLPALLITGDTAPERLREARATGVMLLHKPVAPGELYRAIAQVLD